MGDNRKMESDSFSRTKLERLLLLRRSTSARDGTTSHVRIALLCVVMSLWMTVGETSWGAEIEGVFFADRVRVEESSMTLKGVGLLRYLFLKAYVAALYMGEGAAGAEILSDVPKRLEIQYFRAIAGPDFGKAAEAVLADNVPASTIAALRPRLDQLHALYEDVRPGDRYALSYVPGIGTELTLNGTRKGIVKGADFASAYFAIWLGQKPISTALKSQLLNLPP
jgi:hypothetical protein